VIEVSRYVLAAIVAQTHLWRQGTDLPGTISVFAFYTLSGYLITRVLNTRYGFTWSGTARFTTNRILRLWPAYAAIMILTLAALQVFPLEQFYSSIRAPHTAYEIVTAITIAGQTSFDFLQRVPTEPLATSWSLSIEVSCYLLLALYFAKSPARLSAFLLLGLIGMAVSTMHCAGAYVVEYGSYCFQNRYGVVQAGFVPFACGGLYYFQQKALALWIGRHRAILVALLAIAAAAMFVGPVLSATVGPFLGIPLTWIVLATATDARPTRTQDFFGRASYHLFIAHMPTAAVLATGLHFERASPMIFVTALAAVLCLSRSRADRTADQPAETADLVNNRRAAAGGQTTALDWLRRLPDRHCSGGGALRAAPRTHPDLGDNAKCAAVAA
jgi:peptidoglycan/LPS O-acetylase OafA/YrhL